MRDPRVPELEAGLFASALICQAQAERLAVFERENAHLRTVAARVGCQYGFRAANGGCMLGYPGCACMDDLIWATSFPPATDQEHYIARLEQRAAALGERVRIAATNFRSMAEGFERSREPSKAAACASMADLMDDGVGAAA